MSGDLRCVEGRLFRHDPQHDDPYLETDVGECPDCSGDGCENGEWVEVPSEPTPEMLEAGYDATRLADGTPQFFSAGFCLGHAGNIYRAMLAAAPKALRARALATHGEG